MAVGWNISIEISRFRNAGIVASDYLFYSLFTAFLLLIVCEKEGKSCQNLVTRPLIMGFCLLDLLVGYRFWILYRDLWSYKKAPGGVAFFGCVVWKLRGEYGNYRGPGVDFLCQIYQSYYFTFFSSYSVEIVKSLGI